MNPPDGLSAAGLAAWGVQIARSKAIPIPTCSSKPAARYAYAVDLAAGSREKWFAEGMRLTVLWPNGIESAHPLPKVIRDAEHDAAKFAVALGIDAKVTGRPGRKPEAVIGPKIGRSPAAKLRAVKL